MDTPATFGSTPTDSIGICLGIEVHKGIGVHVGILHHVHNGEPAFLNLAFHCFLKDDPLSEVKPTYRWLNLEVDALLKPSIAAWCQRIVKRQIQIPYGLNSINSKFNKEGILELATNEYGLSCATFVLKILEYGGVQLLDCTTWPKADQEDEEAQRRLVFLLTYYKSYYGITDAHIRNVKSEIGCKRIRPEEVAAAAPAYEGEAINHEVCKPMGLSLRKCLPFPIK